MPAKYEPPDVKSALTPDEIRERYRDTALVIFKEQYLQGTQSVGESDRESTTYLSFGINRRVMTYNNNGNESVIVRKSAANAVVPANEPSRHSSKILNIHRIPRESCVIN